MLGMRLSFAITLPVGALIGALIGGMAGAAELPSGPNRDLVSRMCAACHDLDMVLGAAGANREAWDGAIDQMTEYGLKITADERAKILEYLATVLGPDSTVAKR
jgi:cytochrome c5